MTAGMGTSMRYPRVRFSPTTMVEYGKEGKERERGVEGGQKVRDAGEYISTLEVCKYAKIAQNEIEASMHFGCGWSM